MKVFVLPFFSNLKGLQGKLSHLRLETWNLFEIVNIEVVPLLLEMSLAHFIRCCFSYATE